MDCIGRILIHIMSWRGTKGARLLAKGNLRKCRIGQWRSATYVGACRPSPIMLLKEAHVHRTAVFNPNIRSPAAQIHMDTVTVVVNIPDISGRSASAVEFIQTTARSIIDQQS